ncbi:MAG: GyrI-like domain-containing protein [Acidobacteriaceae bacterium]
MRSCNPAWSMARRRATTGSRRCWRRRRPEESSMVPVSWTRRRSSRPPRRRPPFSGSRFHGRRFARSWVRATANSWPPSPLRASPSPGRGLRITMRMDPQVFDFEIGVPVTAPISATGRVQPGQLPAMIVARTVYHGVYEGLSSAWAEFDAWIRTGDHTPAPDLWERYLAGPESGPDPATWRTELNRPLIR